jgi:hypothetical protein
MRPGEKIKSLNPWQVFTIAVIRAGVAMGMRIATGCELLSGAVDKAALILYS